VFYAIYPREGIGPGRVGLCRPDNVLSLVCRQHTGCGREHIARPEAQRFPSKSGIPRHGPKKKKLYDKPILDTSILKNNV